MNGKGDRPRPVNGQRYRENYSGAFGPSCDHEYRKVYPNRLRSATVCEKCRRVIDYKGKVIQAGRPNRESDGR